MDNSERMAKRGHLNHRSQLVLLKGEEVRRRRQELGWRQTDLGEMADLDKATISQIETNRNKRVGGNSALRIAEALGVDFDELLLERAPEKVAPTLDQFTYRPLIDVLNRINTNLDRIATALERQFPPER